MSETENDEHNTDIALARYMLDSCREIIHEQRQIIAQLREQQRGSMSVVLDHRDAQLPTRAHPGDAGFDLYVSQPATIRPGHFVDIECDVRIELPPDMWGLVIGRSSTLRKRGLMVNQGVIDSGYRGPMYAGVWNLADHVVEVQVGERIAQIIPVPLTAGRIERVAQVSRLGVGDRGSDGFGSTGT